MKSDKIVKIIISGVLIVGLSGAFLDAFYNRQNIHDIINEEVTIMSQAEYNMFVQLKVTPVVEATQDILAMRKIHTAIILPDYVLKIDRTVEFIDVAISDLMTENITVNQKVSRDRTIGSLNKLKVDLQDLKKRLNDFGVGETIFDFQQDQEYEVIYTRITNSLMEIDDYIGLGEEFKQKNDGIQR